MRFLFTTFEGGGHVPPAIQVAGVLAGRGHAVLFVSDEANRTQAEEAGLTFESWRTAPNRTTLAGADDPLDDWRTWWPPRIVRRVCQAVISGPAGAYAADTLALVDAFKPDVIVSQELLFGVLLAGERAGVPVSLLTANVWSFPTRDGMPPFGPGFPPARTPIAQQREATVRRMVTSWYDAGLADLNAARAAHGLSPLARMLDQLKTARLILLGTARHFDYDAPSSDGVYQYAGPLGAIPAWAQQRTLPDTLFDPGRPNVLVSFSTAHPGQQRIIGRVIRALAALPVHGIVTLGPAITEKGLPKAPNVAVFDHLPHDAVIPHCRLVICHGGHGTVIRPLMQGVPVLCIATGRDRPENAQRIVFHGVGLKLSRFAGARSIRAAVRTILGDAGFASRTAALGRAIAEEADGGQRAADHLERLAVPA